LAPRPKRRRASYVLSHARAGLHGCAAPGISIQTAHRVFRSVERIEMRGPLDDRDNLQPCRLSVSLPFNQYTSSSLARRFRSIWPHPFFCYNSWGVAGCESVPMLFGTLPSNPAERGVPKTPQARGFLRDTEALARGEPSPHKIISIS
jgi:hypothetical protein